MVSKLEKLREMLYLAISNGNPEEILLMSQRLDKEIVCHMRKQLKKNYLAKGRIIRQSVG